MVIGCIFSVILQLDSLLHKEYTKDKNLKEVLEKILYNKIYYFFLKIKYIKEQKNII